MRVLNVSIFILLYVFLLLGPLLTPLTMLAGVIETSYSYTLQKQKLGKTREDSYTSEGHHGAITWYLWKYTGIEVNYSVNSDISIAQDDSSFGSDVVLIESRQEVYTEVYGGGIRQLLASNKGLLVPLLSLGIAKEIKKSKTRYTYTLNNVSLVRDNPVETIENDAVFAAFVLKLNLTKNFGINGTVRTVFKTFRPNEAQYNIRYGAGFSWMF